MKGGRLLNLCVIECGVMESVVGGGRKRCETTAARARPPECMSLERGERCVVVFVLVLAFGGVELLLFLFSPDPSLHPPPTTRTHLAPVCALLLTRENGQILPVPLIAPWMEWLWVVVVG